MYDMLPFPRITSKTAEGQISELMAYITQLKESLEFILMNISVDNLSPELIEKLNNLGADIEKSNQRAEEELAQVSNKSLTVSDVCNSEIFKVAVSQEISGMENAVNDIEKRLTDVETQLEKEN